MTAERAQPPARYGRYEVLFRIAAGGMAEVYVARLLGEGGFEKLVALKRMLPTLAEDERFVNMFLDEGRVAANISSPHVVSTLDLGRADDDSLYLVMELVVGVSLSTLLKVVAKAGEPFPLPLAVELIAQAAMGLEDAHEARTIHGEPLGIVHRDISPQNVLVDVSGRVRITDFGVARALERVTQTQSGEVKGKLAYFAPEQARAKPLDRRADVYALGIVAWELFAGRRLFIGDGPADVLLKVLEMQAPPLDTVRADVPPALAAAVAHALERDLDRRTASAGDFAAELRAALPGSGSAALGKFVRARGGEALLRLEEGIRALVPSTPSGRVSGTRLPLPTVEEATTRTPSVSGVLSRGPAEAPSMSSSAMMSGAAMSSAAMSGAAMSSASAAVPATPVLPATAPPAAPATRWPAAIAALAGLGLAAGGAAYWLIPSPTPMTTPAAPIAVSAPVDLAAPPPEPTPPEIPTATAPTATPTVPVELVEPTAFERARDDERRRTGSSGAATEIAPEPPPPVAVAEPTPPERTERTPERTERPERTPERAERTPERTEPAEGNGMTGRGSDGLRGMDDFDSELGGP